MRTTARTRFPGLSPTRTAAPHEEQAEAQRTAFARYSRNGAAGQASAEVLGDSMEECLAVEVFLARAIFIQQVVLPDGIQEPAWLSPTTVPCW